MKLKNKIKIITLEYLFFIVKFNILKIRKKNKIKFKNPNEKNKFRYVLSMACLKKPIPKNIDIGI